MPAVTCQSCGKTVRIQGLAAVCPSCGQLVTLQERQVQKLDPHAAPLSDVPPPPVLPAAPASRPPETAKLVLFLVTGFIGLVILVDWARLRFGSGAAPAPVVVAPPAPAPAPAPARPVAAVPERPLLFSEEPYEKPQPTTARAAPAPVPEKRILPTTRPHAELARLQPRPNPSVARADVTDEQIGQAIRRGVDYLLAEFHQSRLKGADRYDPETFAGLNALAVYAMLHAGQAIDGPRLGINTELMKSALDRLKDFPMSGNRATYSRSLRLSALGVYARSEDRSIMEGDAQWLLKSSMDGAYTYGMPAPGQTRSSGGWDNSNSQYGALGLWAAAEAGIPVPREYWAAVENHWIDAQSHSGGWGYTRGAAATLSMTSAGINMLFVARQQALNDAAMPPGSPLGRAMERAIEWLDEGDNAITIGGHPGYTLYGLERAGLASGYKYFGAHDWYLVLAKRAVQQQQKDGSWHGSDGPVAETAFTLLFLARGRHPVFLAKLRFDGNWNNRPRDIAHLTAFASRQLERPLNFQIVGLERSWRDWTDSSVLFLSSDRELTLSDSDLDKLRQYALHGGLILTHADRDSPAFTNFVQGLARKLFDRELAPVEPEHLVYSITFPLKDRPPLQGVSNGGRLLLVHSPADIGRQWNRRADPRNRTAIELATNIVIYASGKRDFRNRISSPLVAAPTAEPIGVIPLARLRHAGNWDPEPAAWQRFARSFEADTSIRIDLKPVEPRDLTIELAPVAHLTGTDALALDDEEADALRQFVARGGTLIIDAFAGQNTFLDSVRSELLPRLFPSAKPSEVLPGHVLLSGDDRGRVDLDEPKVRGYVTEVMGRKVPPLQLVRGGAGQILLSDLDLTSGLLGTNTWGIAGYQPAYAEALVRNTIFWTIRMRGR